MGGPLKTEAKNRAHSRRNGVSMALVLGLVTWAGALQPAMAQKRDGNTPSGFEVPRWVVLKFNEINVRKGPGSDYDVAFTYREGKNLPVVVVGETHEWRRICDHQGAVGWVKRNAVDTKRYGLRLGGGDLKILKKPKADAGTVAILPQGALAQIDDCEEGWCQLKGDGVRGFVPANSIWGGAEPPRCPRP